MKMLSLTKAGLFVGGKLHKVWTGAGRGAVVIDETQMWAGAASIILFTWVWDWWEGSKGEHIRTLSVRSWDGNQRDRARMNTGCQNDQLPLLHNMYMLVWLCHWLHPLKVTCKKTLYDVFLVVFEQKERRHESMPILRRNTVINTRLSERNGTKKCWMFF